VTTDASPKIDGERPLRRDAARNRERILEAAGEVFATRGLEVTLDDIAHHAGVGVGTVYRRFHDKEQLIDALFDDRMDAVLTVAEEALAADDPWLGLEGFFVSIGLWRRYLTIVLDGLRTRRDRPTPLPVPPLEHGQLELCMRGWRPARGVRPAAE
jgi:AcrR family transcriptional regulator